MSKSVNLSNTSRYVDTELFQEADAQCQPTDNYSWGLWETPDLGDTIQENLAPSAMQGDLQKSIDMRGVVNGDLDKDATLNRATNAIGNAVRRVNSSSSGRIDKIAEDMCGDPNTWWLLAEINDVFDPLNDIVPGVELVLPDYDQMQNMLMERDIRSSVSNKLPTKW